MGTWRSTEKTAAESVGDVTAPSSTAIHTSSPSTKWPKRVISPTLTAMPAVASTLASAVERRMSAQRVVRPPSARMTTRAAKPSERARSASSNFTPSPDSPMAIPTPRNSSSEGSPARAPSRAARMATITTTALTRRMLSRSITGVILPDRGCQEENVDRSPASQTTGESTHQR